MTQFFFQSLLTNPTIDFFRVTFIVVVTDFDINFKVSYSVLTSFLKSAATTFNSYWSIYHLVWYQDLLDFFGLDLFSLYDRSNKAKELCGICGPTMIYFVNGSITHAITDLGDVDDDVAGGVDHQHQVIPLREIFSPIWPVLNCSILQHLKFVRQSSSVH